MDKQIEKMYEARKRCGEHPCVEGVKKEYRETEH